VKIYITRHGQVETNAEYFGDVTYPKGEVPLSEMGQEQSRLLGRRLKKLNFHGKIFASPFLRTMETAELIAEETGSSIYPTPGLHEIFKTLDDWKDYQGSTLEELIKKYPHTASDAVMEYPWWIPEQEDYEIVRQRVASALHEIMQEDEDVLIVGHGASVIAALHFVRAKRDVPGVWNCSLSMFDTKDLKAAFANDVSHLPYHMISNNKLLMQDKVYDIEIPEALKAEQGLKLMHIGDTVSADYPWYKELIEKVKPDIIIHTGDTADEVKVGRKPEVTEEYLDRVSALMDILKASGSKVYWITGNNDLPDEIERMAPFVKIIQPDSILDIEGLRICVAHQKQQFSKRADIYLYGHSSRFELWSDAMNTPERDVWYLNTMWNAYVCVLPARKLYRLGRPDIL